MAGKYNKNNPKKSLALLLALVMLIGCLVGGTVAWLFTQSNSVTNTFVAGDIGEMTLLENNGTDDDGMEYMIIPGKNIEKDPKLNFSGANVAAYVFVEFENANNAAWTYNTNENQYEIKNGTDVVLSFKVADGWLPVEGKTNVFYRTVDANGSLNNVSVIADDTITVASTILDGNIESITDAADSLKITAYAIQQYGFNTAALAWTDGLGKS